MKGPTAKAAPTKPVLRHVLNLWTLVWHPIRSREWPLERQLCDLQAAGFDGFMTQLTPRHAKLGERLGLMRVGWFRSGKPDEIALLLRSQRDAGARHVSVHLGEHDTPASAALRLAVRLMTEAKTLGLEAAIETHRDTCTETPEKTFALADTYERATGELLPLVWDFSHFAVAKHLQPPFWPRLGVRPDLIQRAQQFHFRPFNGHHCQVPVTDGRGRFTPEFRDYQPFVEDVMAAWLATASPGREMIALPELGPLWLGYNLHAFPPSWSEAQVLRGAIERAWHRRLRAWRPNSTTR